MPLSSKQEPLLGGKQEVRMAAWRRTIFLITFVNYAMAHFTRKCYTLSLIHI